MIKERTEIWKTSIHGYKCAQAQTETFVILRMHYSFTNCYSKQYSSHYDSTYNSTRGNYWIWCLTQSSLLKNMITSYSFSKRKKIKLESWRAVCCILTDWMLLRAPTALTKEGIVSKICRYSHIIPCKFTRSTN